ncbi:hypothetical protein TNCV_2555821 [Trichonephila clavipes]|nr:hypothetical protein TNCV_2555821 [Trichonephila clavipes]
MVLSYSHSSGEKNPEDNRYKDLTMPFVIANEKKKFVSSFPRGENHHLPRIVDTWEKFLPSIDQSEVGNSSVPVERARTRTGVPLWFEDPGRKRTQRRNDPINNNEDASPQISSADSLMKKVAVFEFQNQMPLKTCHVEGLMNIKYAEAQSSLLSVVWEFEDECGSSGEQYLPLNHGSKLQDPSPEALRLLQSTM